MEEHITKHAFNQSTEQMVKIDWPQKYKMYIKILVLKSICTKENMEYPGTISAYTFCQTLQIIPFPRLTYIKEQDNIYLPLFQKHFFFSFLKEDNKFKNTAQTSHRENSSLP